jgi:hypothetical protein
MNDRRIHLDLAMRVHWTIRPPKMKLALTFSQVGMQSAPYVFTVRFSGLPDTSALSEVEVALIDEIYAKHRNLSEAGLVALTHTLPEWHDPGESSKPIPFEAILRAGGKGEDEIRAIQREAAADDFMDRTLAAV